jgi:two-component system, NtrC family, response regulator AtoC
LDAPQPIAMLGAMPCSVLIVDDESLIRWSVKEHLHELGHDVIEAASGREARRHCGDDVDLILLDVALPDASGLELLAELHAANADLPIIMMTADSSADTAVKALQSGASHYLTKPLNLDELGLQVGKALEHSKLRRQVRALRDKEGSAFGFDRFIGNSQAMKQAKSMLAQIATTPVSTVLLTGESGTGKDLAAKAVHYHSDRAGAPFVNITCSAMPEMLLESELFGHEKGAFTDARQQKAGLFEQADNGTVFLDEIGEMSPVLQSKLLRVLEERAFRRVGGSKDIRVNVRVIAATNRDLKAEVKKGCFREDLYYRLNVMAVHLPPLRERVEDIPLLAQYFMQRFAEEFRKPVKGLDDAAMQLLMQHPWPGNIRELRNAIERAVLLSQGELLGRDLFLSVQGEVDLDDSFRLPHGGVNLEHLERNLVVQALERTGGNQTQAARLLGLNRDQIRYRIEKFGIAR